MGTKNKTKQRKAGINMLLNELIAISPKDADFWLYDETQNNKYGVINSVKDAPAFTRYMKVWRLNPNYGGYSVILQFRGDLNTPSGRVNVLGITTDGKIIIDDGETKLIKIKDETFGFSFYYKKRKYNNMDVLKF